MSFWSNLRGDEPPAKASAPLADLSGATWYGLRGDLERPIAHAPTGAARRRASLARSRALEADPKPTPTPHRFSLLLARKPMPVGMVGPQGARWRGWFAAWREMCDRSREAGLPPLRPGEGPRK